MPILLTFGDSNTHGTPPIEVRGEYRRFGADIRWPQVCLRQLGAGWELAEEGLPGRTAAFDDPVMGDHMNGRSGLRIALQSHGPIDVLTIMLGTNDVKARFASTPDMVLAGVAGLVDVAQSLEMQQRHGGFKILLICPPPVEEVGPIMGEFYGAAARSRGLPSLYRAFAKARGIGFLDAGDVIAVSPVDGIHYEAEAHGKLGVAVADAITRL
ncbi:SGNH/GDSL hydrolase family protein [Thioclava sp. FR2]|uniref:SGNH/GDSL hydrolase family protein n=1 Tax=Thioclava sp. FR2 TaxID=3445780 RepID=UPI003EC09FC3